MVKARQNSSAAARLIALLMAVLMLSICGLNIKADAQASGFYVSGTQIMDANGNPFMMRGVNIAHAWFTQNTTTSIEAAARNGANTVRIVCANGRKWTKTSKSELESIVNTCKNNNLVCILEVHDATGSDSTYELDEAVNYWIENKSVLAGNEKYVILNIANEWFGTWDGYSWAEGNKSAIRKLRDAGITNMLMVDCAGWGQYPDSIKYYGRSVFEADSLANTVFSIHMYEYAGGDSYTVRTNIDNALGIGVPVVIGEFGAYHSNGDVDEATIMSYCTEKGVGYLGWSWKGNSSDLSYLDIANDWEGTSLTSWGNTLVYGDGGLKQTSKTCTVYEYQPPESSSDTSSSYDTSSEDSSSNSEQENDPYVSAFWGESTAGPWGQAVSVLTTGSGGWFDAGAIKENGYFYVEYSNNNAKQIELILQSWSGGAGWAKVQAFEYGEANGHHYAKFSYEDCVNAFGTSDFAGKLDQIHAGCKKNTTTVYSVCYCYYR